MMLMTVFLPGFLYVSVVALEPDNNYKENQYLMSFNIFSRGFDWSEEELIPQNVFAYNLRNEFKFKNYTWAVGVRGRDVFGRRYVSSKGLAHAWQVLLKWTRP
uniref:Nicotinate phosphoribosyltransferase n=1 Tax=Lygus hesperus TaxID=30085 RepID=A0A0A9VSC7_LYGHE